MALKGNDPRFDRLERKARQATKVVLDLSRQEREILNDLRLSMGVVSNVQLLRLALHRLYREHYGRPYDGQAVTGHPAGQPANANGAANGKRGNGAGV